MLSKFEKGIQELLNMNPDWDKEVTAFLENKNNTDNTDDNDTQRELLDKFTEVLEDIIEEANNSGIAIDEVVSLFEKKECYKFAKTYIKRKMQTFESFKVLRDLEKNDKIKAKFCIDLIWNSYILRYDPFLDFDSSSIISEKEYFSIGSCLDSFTDVCVVRLLCGSAISKELEEDSGLSTEICQYVAEKIDNDFEKIKLNYIVKRLSSIKKN